MAFAKQYFSSYKSNNNLDYYLEIWVDGYTGGNPTEIKLGAGGPVISYDTDQEDRFSPILSSQCELPFMVTGVGTEFFIRQLREVYKDKQVYLHLYRATSSTYSTVKPIWSGFLIMDLGSGEDVSFPYEQKLKFVDGLSLLKDIDFVDLSRTDTPPGDTIPLNERTQGNYSKFNMYYGPALYTFWIKEILKKVGAATSGVNGQGVSLNYGFTTAVNWYNGKMQNTNQASDPLGLTKCVVTMFHEKNDQEVFTPDNCYLVLKELLRHWGARITYWQHEFWIVQIPEYITTESGSLNNPTNINSRQYDLSGSLLGSQDYLGDEYYTRYEQTIQTDKVSKIVGTQYNYLPMINNVDAQFLSFASNNYYGGFPYGNNAENQEIYQGTIVDPSTADFLFLSIPLNWVWDMGSSALVNGHTNGWHCQVRFNFFASQLLNGTVTTFYLQYDSNGSYYWIPGANWRPLGTESPNYKIKSRQLVESNYVGFEEQIPFVDSSGNPISMLGDWDFFLDIEKYGTSGNNPGSFICNFLGYGYQIRQFKPQTTIGSIPSPSGSGSTTSGTVSWSNTLEVPGTTNFSILPFSQLGFNAGTSTLDIRLITSSPFRGVLQALNTTQAATYGITLNTQIDNNTNTERYSFGTLLWGDAVQQFAIGSLKVNTGTAFEKTDADGEWGRGILTGDKTFTELLIHEFLTGQLEVVISPSMRLVVGDSNKDVTISGVTRPRFVNPIGILRETRNGPDPVYFFRRGSFHSLYDEWDYEGYQILRDSVTSTTTTNDIGDLGGSQDSNPVSAAKLIGNVTDALSTNSTIASLRQTIPSIGANVAVNGNFNVATGWTLGTGWTIDTTASKAKFAATGSLSSLSQINLTEGTKYQVIFTIDITAGQLTVKAGSSGSSQVITVAGQYELYLLCEGSTSIQFQAGTTFTGSISQVSIADQKSLSSVPIESLGQAVFKTNDTFNIVNSINGEVIPLTVTSNQGATDTAISVTAVPLFDDIGIDSVLLINQDDLSAQYQNKTKGTVAGFGIDADGISKGGIEITGWLNSDTMSGAAVTNVPTALSVKNYVNAQVGSADTLQEVTDNGNTTTNSIRIGSSSAPAGGVGLHVDTEIRVDGNDGVATKKIRSSYFSSSQNIIIESGSSANIIHNIGSTEKMRLTSTGLGIGTTAPNMPLSIESSADFLAYFKSTDNKGFIGIADNDTTAFISAENSTMSIGAATGVNANNLNINLSNNNIGIGTISARAKLEVYSSSLSNSAFTIYDGLYNFNFGWGARNTGSNYLDIYRNASITNFDTSSNGYNFNISNSEKMRLTSGGNLLIGTTTDGGEKLVVQDSAQAKMRLVSDGNNGARFDLHSSGGGRYSLQALSNGDFFMFDEASGHTVQRYFDGASGAWAWYTVGSEKMRLTSGGNLLIGTTTNSAKLTVDETTTNNLTVAHFKHNQGAVISDIILENSAGANNTGFNINFKLASSGASAKIGAIRTNSPGAGDTDMVFSTSTNGGSVNEAMRITHDSNVLIGTTTDSGQKLLVDGTAKVEQYFYINDTGNSNLFFIRNESTFASIDNGTRTLNFVGGDKIFLNGSFAEAMRIKSNGNVGIGTTNPLSALDVEGDIELSGVIKGRESDWTYYSIPTGDGSYPHLFYTRTNSGASLLRVKIGGGSVIGSTEFTNNNFSINTNQLYVSESSGNVGIGTSSPATSLEVNGCISATGVLNAFTSSPGIQMGHDGAGAFIVASGSGGNADEMKFSVGSNGEAMRIQSNKNISIGTTTDSGDKLQVNGTTRISGVTIIGNQVIFGFGSNGGNVTFNSTNLILTANSGKGISLNPNNQSSGSLIITSTGNANFSGNVSIGGTAGAVYKLDVVGKQRVQSVLELDNVLTLNAISTPSDPASGQSSIYMDSADGAIKVKINVGGTVVTKTIASFE